MSGAKFASITAGLLARKGEAMPWREAEAAKAPLAWRDLPPIVTPPPPRVTAPVLAPPRLDAPKEKSCSLRLSMHDYERLGIIAVKTGTTRPQLLKDALARFLASQAAHLSCACLGPCETGACGTGSANA